MYLIVGLGNPEPEYSNTRHNMGFDVINQLSTKCGISMTKNKFGGIYGTGQIGNEKIILLKPQTYMNDSGKSIVECKNYFKIENDKIIVVYDDVDLPVGSIRIRERGSANTHNGMKSVVQCLGTTQFPRVRIGIGEADIDIRQYVLEKIHPSEREIIVDGINKGVQAVIEIIQNSIIAAMNKFN